MQHIHEFQELGIHIKSNAVQQKTKCPKCNHERKNKNDPSLSVNIQSGNYNCHHCGWSGNVKFKAKQPYIEPDVHSVELSDRTISYFKKRGITESTLANWKVTESIEFFPQVQKKRKAINFNYYRNGKLINVKFRDAEKNFKMVKGAELIFYGLDNIKDVDHCYIVEGEMDAMSLFESGVYSVVSVPNGATKGNQRLEYLDNCHSYFKNMKRITIFTDSDQAGIALRNELARRLGLHRCEYIELDGFKDANDVLLDKGSEYLRNVLKTAKKFPVEGLFDISKHWNRILNYTEVGIENFSMGFESDELLKIDFGSWTTITGIPNSGKSDFLDQVCVNMAMQHGFRVGYFAPESFPFEGHIKRIANKLMHKNVGVDDLNKCKDFIEEHFYLLKIDLENLTLKGILDKFRELVLAKGCNLFVIDPWNMLDHSQQKDFTYIGKILSEITQFVQQTNTHLFLVAHPRKMTMTNGIYDVCTPYDISGSSDFFNKTYNAISVYRELGVKTEYGSDAVRVYIQKVKRKENGRQGDFGVAPDFDNGGVYRNIKTKSRLTVHTDNDVPF